MTHTTLVQCNLAAASAIVNPLFSSMSKRAGESFAAGESFGSSQRLRSDWTTRLPTWTVTQLEATLSVKNCVIQHNGDWSIIQLGAAGHDWSSIKLRATRSHERSLNAEGEVYLLRNTDGGRYIRRFDDPAEGFFTRAEKNNVTRWCCGASLHNLGTTPQSLVIFRST